MKTTELFNQVSSYKDRYNAYLKGKNPKDYHNWEGFVLNCKKIVEENMDNAIIDDVEYYIFDFLHNEGF